MNKCVRCRKRKAKRTCPALGAKICQQCCGKLRGKEIRCPPGCPYLDKHSTYQERREIDRNRNVPPPPAEDILREERMAWLALHAEIPVYSAATGREGVKDRDAYAAYQYARQELEKKGMIFLLSDSRLTPTNPLGDEVVKSMEGCRYQKKIILPGESQSYTVDEMLRVLDRILLSVRTAAGKDLSGTRYLEQMLMRISRLREAPPGDRFS
jgi:hypothetical protein